MELGQDRYLVMPSPEEAQLCQSPLLTFKNPTLEATYRKLSSTQWCRGWDLRFSLSAIFIQAMYYVSAFVQGFSIGTVEKLYTCILVLRFGLLWSLPQSTFTRHRSILMATLRILFAAVVFSALPEWPQPVCIVQDTRCFIRHLFIGSGIFSLTYMGIGVPFIVRDWLVLQGSLTAWLTWHTPSHLCHLVLRSHKGAEYTWRLYTWLTRAMALVNGSSSDGTGSSCTFATAGPGTTSNRFDSAMLQPFTSQMAATIDHVTLVDPGSLAGSSCTWNGVCSCIAATRGNISSSSSSSCWWTPPHQQQCPALVPPASAATASAAAAAAATAACGAADLSGPCQATVVFLLLVWGLLLPLLVLYLLEWRSRVCFLRSTLQGPAGSQQHPPQGPCSSSGGGSSSRGCSRMLPLPTLLIAVVCGSFLVAMLWEVVRAWHGLLA